MIYGPASGSKKQRRKAERDARRVRALDLRLQKIYALARLMKSEEELDIYLRDTLDDEMRAETKKLIEPFCLFKFRKVTLVGPSGIDVAAQPEKAVLEVVH